MGEGRPVEQRGGGWSVMALINKCRQRLHSKEGRPSGSRMAGAEEKWAGTIGTKVFYSAEREKYTHLGNNAWQVLHLAPPSLGSRHRLRPLTYLHDLLCICDNIDNIVQECLKRGAELGVLGAF